MKKYILCLLLMSTTNALAIEANAKVGFDFLRFRQDVNKTVKDTTKDGMGFTLGAEIIPVDLGIASFGAGFEYNFGIKDIRFDGAFEKSKIFAPFYVLSRINVYKYKDASAYFVARFGGVYSNIRDAKKTESIEGGVYYGLGFGGDYKYFTTELLYDGAYIPNQEENEIQHKIGLKIGVRVGDFIKGSVKEKEKTTVEKVVYVDNTTYHPVCEELLVRQGDIVDIDKVIDLFDKKTVPKGTKYQIIENIDTSKVGKQVLKVRLKFPNNTTKDFEINATVMPRLLHANCVDNKCTIQGFGFDKSIPNKDTEDNMIELVNLINNYASSGVVTVIGHTDSVGKEDYNYNLGFKRALYISDNLRKNGLNKNIKINSIISEGETNPIDTNETKIGRYNNRRVELIFDNLEKE